MDQYQSQDWVQSLHQFEHIIATNSESLQVESIIKLSRLSNRIPVSILVSTVPILVDLLDTSTANSVLKASVYCLKCISCQGDGKLAVTIGQSRAIHRILCLLPQSELALQRVLLKCIRNIVAFDGPNRVNLVRIGGLKVVVDMLNSDTCPDDSLRRLLLDILSALALLREVRRSVFNLRAVGLLVEACKVGKMVSRARAGQAIGLLGLVKRARRELVNSGAIEALVDLLRNGDVSTRLVAGNALGVISSHVDYIRPVAEHGVIPLYAELLREQEPLGKEIAEDVFCILAVTDDNAVAIVEHLVTIMRGNDNESVGAAADVVWDLSSYKHVLPVFHSFGVISLLVELLRRSDDSNVKEKVCGAIGQLSYNDAERVVIADLGGISVLISMLEDESEEVKDNAAQALVCLYEDPLLCDRMSGALSHPVFLRVRERMVQTRAAELRLAESVRQMTVDELTWNPALG